LKVESSRVGLDQKIKTSQPNMKVNMTRPNLKNWDKLVWTKSIQTEESRWVKPISRSKGVSLSQIIDLSQLESKVESNQPKPKVEVRSIGAKSRVESVQIEGWAKSTKIEVQITTWTKGQAKTI